MVNRKKNKIKQRKRIEKEKLRNVYIFVFYQSIKQDFF